MLCHTKVSSCPGRGAGKEPPSGQEDRNFRPIIVGVGNADPYPEQGEAIRALGQRFGMPLERSRCYPYRRD